MRDASLSTGKQAKEIATYQAIYACALTRADRLQVFDSENNVLEGLACAPVRVGLSVATETETVCKIILVYLDSVKVLAILLLCAIANILVNLAFFFSKCFFSAINERIIIKTE